MRLVIKYLAVILLLTVASATLADMNDEGDANAESQAAAAAGKPRPGDPMQGARYPFTLGLDVSYWLIQPKNEFINVTYNNRLGSSVYLGYRLRGILGFELGYSWTDDTAKSYSVAPGSNFFGQTAAYSDTYIGKIRLKETYLDAYGHYRAAKKLELKYGLGLGWVRQTIKIDRLNPTPAVVIDDTLTQDLILIQGHTRMVYRFNLGAQTLFTKTIGGRAIMTYQTTSTIQAKGLQAGVNPYMFSNSFIIAIGLFWNVNGYYYFPDWT